MKYFVCVYHTNKLMFKKKGCVTLRSKDELFTFVAHNKFLFRLEFSYTGTHFAQVYRSSISCLESSGSRLLVLLIGCLLHIFVLNQKSFKQNLPKSFSTPTWEDVHCRTKAALESSSLVENIICKLRLYWQVQRSHKCNV